MILLALSYALVAPLARPPVAHHPAHAHRAAVRLDAAQIVEVVSGGAIQSALSPLDSELALAGPHFFEGWSTMASDLFNVAAVATFGLAGSYITADRAGAPPSSPSGGRRRRRNADRALQAWDERWDDYPD